jgi:hypothetical protein
MDYMEHNICRKRDCRAGGQEESRSLQEPKPSRVISGFRRDVDEIYALLGYYAALSGSSVPTFRGNQSVPSSGVNMGPTGCPEKSV